MKMVEGGGRGGSGAPWLWSRYVVLAVTAAPFLVADHSESSRHLTEETVWLPRTAAALPTSDIFPYGVSRPAFAIPPQRRPRQHERTPERGQGLLATSRGTRRRVSGRARRMAAFPAVTTSAGENCPPSEGASAPKRSHEAGQMERARQCQSVGEMQSFVHSTTVEISDDELVAWPPNVAATALGRTVQLRRQLYFRMRKGQASHEAQEIDTADELISRLLKTIGYALRRPEQPTTMSVYGLSNVLRCLGQLHDSREATPEFKAELSLLAQAVCTAALSNNNATVFVSQAGLQRLVASVVALAKLSLPNDNHMLLTAVAERLQKGDFVARMTPSDLTMVIWSFAVMQSTHHYPLLKILFKRLTKHAIRTSLQGPQIARLLWSTHRIIKVFDQNEHLSQEQQSLLQQSAKACTSLTKELGNWCLVDSPEEGDKVQLSLLSASSDLKLHSLSARNVLDVLTCCSRLETKFNNQTVASSFMHHLTRPAIASCYSSFQIAQILSWLHPLALPMDQAHLLGEEFLRRLRQNGAAYCTPRDLSTTWRAVALLPNNATRAGIVTPLLEAGRLLILNGTNVDSGDNTTVHVNEFLRSCDHATLSFLVWALAMMEKFDESPLLAALMNRIVQNDVIRYCDADAAARILWALTKLSFHKEDDTIPNEMVSNLLSNAFTSLSGALLADDVTPAAAATAMWAMARASYTHDLGVFDHLVEKLSEPSMLERATTAQVTMALWAIARMVAWEDPLKAKMEYGVHAPPPYLESAPTFAQFLASAERRPQPLTPSGVAQAVWAMGRLQIKDKATVQALANEAMHLCDFFNAQEIANVLWGLSKVGYANRLVDNRQERNATQLLGRKLLPLAAQGKCKAQEAANVLYALARMGIADNVVFHAMSTVLMDQMKDATSQAIANALWAHETAGINAPPALLQAWATKRLGLRVVRDWDDDLTEVSTSSD